MEGYCLDRHFKLWEENNKLLKRVIFITLVISIALIVKVLNPFVEFSGDKVPLLQRIESLNKVRDEVNGSLRTIEKTEKALTGINRYISAQPWQREKEALIERYGRLRVSPPEGGIEPGRYQNEADETIARISAELNENIVEPLLTLVTEEQNRDLEWLNNEIISLSIFIAEWKDQHKGVNWYSTLDLKELTMMGLTKDLTGRLNDFSRVVRREQDIVKQARQAVDNKLQELDKEITTAGDKLTELEKELQTILPQWLRGLVTTEQVIQVLPVALLAVAVYVFYVGLSLTKHFSIYADGKAFEENVRTDPAMSSVWTLIPRGEIGTLLTLAAYILFFIVVWLLLEKAMELQLQWLSIDTSKAWIGGLGIWELFLWLSRLSIIGLIGYVGTMPWRNRRDTGK